MDELRKDELNFYCFMRYGKIPKDFGKPSSKSNKKKREILVATLALIFIAFLLMIFFFLAHIALSI